MHGFFTIALLMFMSISDLARAENPPPDDFNQVPQGLLMPSEQEQQASDQGAPVDAQPPPATVGADGERLMTMEEISKEYAVGNYAKILPQLELLAKNGQHASEELLAIMLKNGKGVEKNPKRAFELMAKAAEANRALAQHYLGVMYFIGEGAEQDPVKSATWLHIAIAHYKEGPEKDRAIKDRDNVLARLARREKERALEIAYDWLEERHEEHLLESK